MICAMNMMKGTADESQCSAEQPPSVGGEFNIQKILLLILTGICMALASALFYLWCLVRRFDRTLDAVNSQQVQPLATANLPDRMLTTEHNVMELQMPLSDSLNDINVIYRSLRRRAGSHPEEPSRSRARTSDSRPPAREPDSDPEPPSPHDEPLHEDDQALRRRSFNDAASRSRDDGDDDGEDEDEEGEDLTIDDDRTVHDHDEFLRREDRHRALMHDMAIQANNMEVALHVATQDRDSLPLTHVIELYEQYAPMLPPPGAYTDENFGSANINTGGIMRLLIEENSERFGNSFLLFA